MSKFLIRLANWFEKMSVKIRRDLASKKHKRFVEKYNLKECEGEKRQSTECNPYECTNLYLADELIKQGIIKKDIPLLDVGCGTGVFLAYLYTKGYTKISGVEVNESYANLALENLKKVSGNDKNVSISCESALDYDINDEVGYIYLFNPFSHKETYDALISKIKESYTRVKRQIKVILLCPTLASYEAFRSCDFLKETESVTSIYQFCNKCVRYSIYET